jgi:myo-inositol-1(or 4)-monophosphatase
VDRNDPRRLVDLAHEVAVEVAERRRNAVTQAEHVVRTKSSPTDLVTETDKATEAYIVEQILAQRPDDGIVGEEGGSRTGTSGVTWIIDPIDGTTNFFYGLAGFNTSIAAAVDGEVVAGVVADPMRHEIFQATLGGGATCNDEPVAVRGLDDLSLALIGTGFSYQRERRVAQAHVVAALMGEVRDIRRLGAAALDLCLVAAGRLDGYFESGLQPWDLAAGALIAREAGAVVADLDGGQPGAHLTIAGGPAIFEALRARLDVLRASGAAVEAPASP